MRVLSTLSLYKVLKGTLVNQTCLSIHGTSLEISLTVPLNLEIKISSRISWMVSGKLSDLILNPRTVELNGWDKFAGRNLYQHFNLIMSNPKLSLKVGDGFSK